MKKFLKFSLYSILGLIGLFVVLLIFVPTENPNERAVVDNPEAVADTPAKETSVTEVLTEEPTEEETAADPIGTRSNPLPFGDTITADVNIYGDGIDAYPASLDLTVTEVIRGQDAWNIVLAENQFNESPTEGYEYALVKVKGALKDAETENYPFHLFSMDFEYVDQEGTTYPLVSTVTPQELSGELYNGGAVEGYVANQVKIGDNF
ncbi:hypothetical protein [Indiicoccus explosivorum]|uniref:hypothetical protein n=1 Tax=Indiicoccus explosivorum TaxID=1917864 RepID=UPI000B440B05|nr:hypothetical protein [Indiicoccus explosivorum]